MWTWLVTLLYGAPPARVCGTAERVPVPVDCGSLPDIRVRTAEQATTYAAYFCERAHAYDLAVAEHGHAAVALTCPAGHASVAVAVVWGVACGRFRTEEEGERYYRRRLRDANPLVFYRPAVRLAVEMVRARLEV